MQQVKSLKSLGPLPTTVRGAERTLEELWAQTELETRAYTGNIITLTTPQHLERVQEALRGLEGRYAGRQIIGVMSSENAGPMSVTAELVAQNGLYVERLTVNASAEQLQGAILPLLRPATVNHVWWATQEAPPAPLLKELTDVADQVIADSLSLGLEFSGRYALADLSWSRSAAWREALAQLFDSQDSLRRLRDVDHLTIWAAARSERSAVLFAGWVASTLGWKNLDAVTFIPHETQREHSDLSGVELSGPNVSFKLEAQGQDAAKATVCLDQMCRVTTLVLPTMTLAEGLARVMVRPERSATFERAWNLAHTALPQIQWEKSAPESTLAGGELSVYDSPQAAAAAAAQAFAASAREAVQARGAFHVALSGGSTPKLMYAELRALDVPWDKVHIYFSDERTVGPDSDQSNYHTAKVGLLDFVPIPAAQIHRMEGERDPAQAAADYAALLPAQLDVVLLGMGDDGHTASLFPGTAGLEEGGRVIANEVPQQQTWRISFTFGEINAARERWLLVTGASKAPVMQQIQRGEGAYPVQRVQQAHWFVDKAALGQK